MIKLGTIYKNLSKKSGVSMYIQNPGVILVEFKDGSQYLYKSKKIGKYKLNKLLALAKRGRGLNTYINKRKPAYEKNTQ